MVQAYCLRDKKHITVVDPKYATNKIGRPVVKGTCPTCKGKVQKLLAAHEVPAELKAKVGKGRRSRRSSRKSKSRKSKSRRSHRRGGCGSAATADV